jgi:hypothetical protein
MAIKPNNSIEKSLYNLEKLKEKIAPGAEKEKIKKLEQARKEIINEINQGENSAAGTIGPVAGIAAPQLKQQKQIEKILASGLEDIYLSLTPAKQKEFKLVGEQTAAKINKLLAKAKVNLGAIIRLIRKWLSLIPGVNRYFLEQEAKIRADEIIKMKNN